MTDDRQAITDEADDAGGVAVLDAAEPNVTTPEMDSADVQHLSEHPDAAVVAAAVIEAEPHDAARVLSALTAERAAEVAPLMDAGQVARAMVEMDPERAAAVVDAMPADAAAAVLSELSPDDRVDILGELGEAKHDELVAGLDAEDRREVMALEQYEPDTAGGIMTTEVTSLYEYLSVGDAIDQLRSLSETLEQMFYVYVIDQRGHLVGVLSMRDMILARPDRILRDIMIGGVRSLPADMDQEEVARLFRRYHYLAMPVVDKQNRLVGLITVDDVVDVLQEETTEDVHKLFGAGAEEKLSSPWHYSFKKRVWWLIVNLGTAFMAAAVVAGFSDTIESLPILAAFMPIVAGMGGNASAQAMAVTVRGLSLGEVDRKLLRHVLKRESIVGLLTGIVTGIITGVIAFFYSLNAVRDADVVVNNPAYNGVVLGTLVCLALIINLGLACASGAGIPFLMKRLGFDPAQSATILATTVTDVVGFFALLGLAAGALHFFGLV